MSDEIWDYQDNFRYDGEPIEPTSPLWVELGGARGDYDRNELWNQLRYDAARRCLRHEPRGQFRPLFEVARTVAYKLPANY